MLRVEQQNSAIQVRTAAYSLTTATDRPYVYLSDAKNKKRFAELFVLSSVHTLHGRDDTTSIETWQIEQTPERIVLSLHTTSNLWQRKTYRYICESTRLRYEIEVEGRGELTEVQYFGGYYSGQVRWGAGFFWSGQNFKKGFNPEPTTAEKYHFTPASGSMIDLAGVPLPGKGGWFFTPPPFCFAFQVGKSWLAMGVEAAPEQNRFSDYQYHGQQESFYSTINYEGYTTVDGCYTLPAIGFDFATSEYDALGKHVESLRSQKLVPTVRQEDKPHWWYEPIYCGWGSQCYVASQEGKRAPDFARQNLYENFLHILEEQGIAPGIVVLDDKWQATYGDNCVDELKWHNIHGFIDQQHEAGRKVLLWLKAWDAEGIPAAECITNSAGLPLAVDPTNPQFEQRFRASIRRMLADYGADGFKLDFTARIPCSPGAKNYGNLWGLELMKRYLFLIYDEAKKTKPDALVMSHTPHPYLADVLDMIRLNDINIGKNVNEAMIHRAKVAALACPDAIIDTDNWPITNRAVWRDYMRLQPALGVPSLYYVTHIDSTGEPLEAEDYLLIREAWKHYRQRANA
jgi:hypothetical protein